MTRAPWLAALLVLGACSPRYTGKGVALTPEALVTDRAWTAGRGVPVLRQRSERDCGPTALAMVLARFTTELPPSALVFAADRRYTSGELRDRARALGFSAFVVAGTLDDIEHELEEGRPAIVGMAKPTLNGPIAHYEVVVGLNRVDQRVATIDPALGLRQNSVTDFLVEWAPAGHVLLVVLGRTEQTAP